MSRKEIRVGLITAAIVALLSVGVYGALSPNTKAPDFALPTLDGKSFTLSSCFKKPGRVVVLDFWASGCPPCRAEMPYLVELQRKYESKGAMVVGVALDRDREKVKTLVKDLKVNYMVPLDPGGARLLPAYQITAIPLTYVVDRKGVIRFVHTGFPTRAKDAQRQAAAKMENQVKQLIAED